MGGQRIIGVDFSSAPTRRKPIVIAGATLHGARLRIDGLAGFDNLPAYARWLAAREPWIGGFDHPFGLPRELVVHFGWPTDWVACIRRYAAEPRAVLRDRFQAFCAARPVGGKFAHRACDGPAGSSPSMKWVNPPVAWMLHAGMPPLLDAGATFPAHAVAGAGAAAPVALEAYPGWLARRITSDSYKSDERAKQTEARRAARAVIVAALARASAIDQVVEIAPAIAAQMIDDGSGDSLDAVLCAVQAAWAARQPGYGLPPGVDPLEGWIAAVPAPHTLPHLETTCAS